MHNVGYRLHLMRAGVIPEEICERCNNIRIDLSGPT